MGDTRAANGDVIPTRIGSYRIHARIASGGMGTVYLATTIRPDGTELRVALKVLHGHLAQEDDVARRFVDEGRVGARIAHPNVVAVHDAGQVESTSFLALEYIHGATLSALLRGTLAAGRLIPIPIATSIFLDLLAGLHAAHEVSDEKGQSLGIVHRDVSPQNILVDLEGRAFISDFGVARVKDAMRTTRSGTMIGKPGYMAPEQLTGMTVDARTDLYASGILFWECLTGQRLFSGVEDQIRGVVSQRVQPSVRSHRIEVPEELDALVAEILEHEPSKRPQSAFDISARMRTVVARASRSEVGAWVESLEGESLAARLRPKATDDDEEEETVARFAPQFLADPSVTLPEPPPPELPQLAAPVLPPRSTLPPLNPPPRSLRPSTQPPPSPEEPSTVVERAVDLRRPTPPMIRAAAPPTAPDAVRRELPTMVVMAQPSTRRRVLGYAIAAGLIVGVAGGIWLGRGRVRTAGGRDPIERSGGSELSPGASSLTPELPALLPPTTAASGAPKPPHPKRRRR